LLCWQEKKSDFNFTPMKKNILTILLLFAGMLIVTNSCNEQIQSSPTPSANQQKQIDSLKKIISEMKPGLGELMLGIQTHHAKLWFAGKNSNWELANFEMDEIHELIEMAQKIETDRTEISSLPMIFPALDSLTASIKNKNEKLFETDFQTLTNTCNNCHVKTNFAFNVITIPSAPPVNNQDFKLPDTK
jgi:hypothetical protein